MITSRNAYSAGGWGEGLKNRVVFTWAFVEMVTWFWVFVTLREERRELANKIAQRKAAEENICCEDRLEGAEADYIRSWIYYIHLM